MKILINIPYDESLCLESSNINNIKNVKEQIFELKGIPYELQKLYKNGRHLEDEELLEIDKSDYLYLFRMKRFICIIKNKNYCIYM
ncbi:hypothetical protein PFNF54_04855 [Plasmodium falciparum NF54]|uniref:Ubiquitin-like domain-containing protein n=1 Tax=Plasmodium falciparum (isolate NF54) TaxID=5843 RepID=W7JYH0_PLAFO|nr:hypothetical protein PFNF54_04855 [Plasmodium falciparum NF54]